MKKIIFIILGIGLISTQVAMAAAGENLFTTYPSFTKDRNKWIIRDANPGQQSEDYLTLDNLSDQTITLSLTVKELSGTKTQPQIIENQNLQNIGNWTKLENNQVTLSAHQKSQVKVIIQVPENAQLGSYQEVVLVSHVQQQTSDLNVATRIGDRIYLNVTDQKNLQANTQNLNVTPLQLALIILASLGIIASLSVPVKTKIKNL